MMKMACTKQLSVGNRIIDSAHKEVFGMIDRIAHSIMARDIAALPEAFDLLENCLCVYFSVEENIAQAAHFDFTKHRLAHQNLLNEFQRMKNWLMEKNGAWSRFEEEGCIDSLKNCLVRHIKEDEEPLKIVLNTHFYDFNP
ncbi:MAG: hemerythrin domain-containing protein [Gallionella sp.]|nr:hemerythrin domain-containing protein [Gallionella sp.]